MGRNVKRLFADFQPKHYILDLNPDREKKKFSGMVIISGHKTGRPSQRLIFHQSGLKISTVSVTKHDKKGDHEIVIDRINHHASYDEVRLHSKEMLYPGNYTVRLEFSGKITQQMNGIYPCFFEENGARKELIATQFESHHAREVFPSIDEPEAKATFDLILTTPSGETVLANTPIKSQEVISQTVHVDGAQGAGEKRSETYTKYDERASEPATQRSATSGSRVSSSARKQAAAMQWMRTEFETTPRMSTYLLAFAYGELGYKEAKTKSGVSVRAYATAVNVSFTEFALDVAVKVLDFYDEYFAIPYPLPKADMIALPDFASGAMENWGLITYREQTMLVDPANSTLATKQYVAMVVAHELAHQWFGNLVTMRWWTDLWLNEGFASWVEYLAVDHLFPEWEMWTQFVVDEQQRAFKLDALEHTHPIEVPVRHPDEIRTIFDTISYSKGASVIHMLNDYLGPSIFRDGLRHYLKQHSYGNTDTADLWVALEEISGKPVASFMRAWTSLAGFPLVNVVVDETNLEMTQERFYVNPETKNKASTVWPVALLAENKMIPELLDEHTKKIYVPDTSELKLNRGQSGFYRVVYNATHLHRLGELIKKGHLTPLDRLGILSDLFEAAKAGKVDTIDVLDFLRVFSDEDNNAVWDVIAGGVVGVRSVMDSEDLRELMKPFIRKLVARQLERLGWEVKKGESHFDQLLRPTIIGLAASADNSAVIAEIHKQFKSMKKPEDIAPDLRGVIYNTSARLGGKAEYDKLFAIHESTSLSEERTTIAGALTSFKQPELAKRSLDLIKSPSVRLQDVSYWVAYSFMNRFSRDATWEWMKSEWKWLGENLGTDLSFYRFPMYAAMAFSNREFLKEFEKFFVPKKEPSFERSINQGIEMLTWQSAWRERALKEVMNFFQTKANQ